MHPKKVFFTREEVLQAKTRIMMDVMPNTVATQLAMVGINSMGIFDE
jgi:hypothetical protein